MQIYHYTRAETLPLILSSRRIRFTRADRLDDRSEVPFDALGLNAKHFFVSSWTSRPDEDWGQWVKYGDNWSGVRIGLTGFPFPWLPTPPSITRELASGESIGIRLYDDPNMTLGVPYSVETMCGNGYIIVQEPAINHDGFGFPVSYSESPLDAVKRHYSVRADGTRVLDGTPSTLARYKGNGWRSQEEVRFALMAFKGPSMDYSQDPDAYRKSYLDDVEAQYNATGSAQPLPAAVECIDLPLHPDAFQGLTVTMGPLVSPKDRDLVKAALDKHAPGAAINESLMTP